MKPRLVTYFLHGILEGLTVLSLEDCLCCCSDKLYPLLVKEAALSELHAEIKSCLSTECRKDAVRLFFYDNLFYDSRVSGSIYT